jgi:4-carboxymuconolactone decarboxylase
MNRSKAAVVCAFGFAALGSVLMLMTHGQGFDKPQRFPQITMDQLSDAQKPVAEEIMKVSSSGLGGPYNSMLRSPVVAERMLNMLDYVRFHTTMPHRLNEFAILIQARLWNSQVEWVAHYPLAIKSGLKPSVAADLSMNRRPRFMTQDEAVVYDFCMELSTKHRVSDTTFKRASDIFTQQQIIDLTAVSGTYVATAMFLSISEQPVPPGTPSDIPRLR